MSLAGTAAITELWAKCKAWFGTTLGNTQDATTVTIQLKNSGSDTLSTTVLPQATPSSGTSPHAGVMSAADKAKLDGIASGATANSASSTTPKMDGTAAVGSESAFARGDHVHPTDTSRQATLVSGTNIKTVGSQSLLGSGNLTPANIGAAASSHAHGNITSGGDITATAPTVASGDCLVINDDSASKITNGPAFGTSTTTFLANNGTWQTPAGTTYSDFTGATSSAAGTHGLVPAPAKHTDTSGYPRVLTDIHGWNQLEGVAVDQTASGVAIGLAFEDYGYTARPIAAATTTVPGIMSAADKSKLDGIASGATANSATTTTPKMDGTAAVGSETAYAKGDHVHPTDTSRAPTSHASSATTYGTGTASNYGHLKLSDSTSSTTSTSGGTAATPKAVKDALDAAKSYADGLAVGAAMFKGTLGPSGATYTEAQLVASSYKKGWYWVVKTAGIYSNLDMALEVGDMVFAVADKANDTFSKNDFTAVQNNVVEMTTDEVDAICV